MIESGYSPDALIDGFKLPNQRSSWTNNPHALNGLGQLNIDITELAPCHDQMIGQLAIEPNGAPDDGQEWQDKRGSVS